MGPTSLRVLVVDDDPDIRTSIETALTLEGYAVATAVDGVDGLTQHLRFDPHLAIVDLVMAGRSGLGFCAALRAAGDRTPVLMLTARDGIDDRVQGLDAGADDYLTKPFALAELFARVRALLRRTQSEPAPAAAFGVRVDVDTRIAERDGRRFQVTEIEAKLLHLLLDHPEQTVTRELIADTVWGPEAAPGSNTIDVYIGYLRAKLELGGLPRLIHTVRGLGYRLAEA